MRHLLRRAPWSARLCITLSAFALGACESNEGTGGIDTVGGTDLPNLPTDTAAGTDTAGETDTQTTGATGDPDTGVTTAPDTGATNPATDTHSDPDSGTGTGTAPPDTTDTTGETTPGGGEIGAPCASAADCEGPNAACLPLPGGYCSHSGCDTAACPSGSTCFKLGDQGSFCIQDCGGAGDCRTGEGYSCDSDNTCWYYEPTTGGSSAIGGPCTSDSDCKDPGAWCYPSTVNGEATGFFAGYCMADCNDNTDCPSGSICDPIFADGSKACIEACGGANGACGAGYGCFDPGICFPGCSASACPANFACDANNDYCVPSCTADSCPNGTVCHDDGTCGAPPCQQTGCEPGYICAQNGDCVADISGGPGAGPGAECPNLPTRDCVGTAAYCGEIIQFDPNLGPGYWDYPINGETDVTDEYRSWSRRDLQMLIKWAAAVVDCKAKAWAGGNGKPDGMGDMSEKDGSIPGTREGSPGHPDGTHEMGYDTDFAYFQTAAAPDNKLRPICPHLDANGTETYHCTALPTTLDLWRSAMMLGTMMTSGRVRVIGVDGKVGPLMEQALDYLCANGWVKGSACTGNRPLAYEVTDEGRGWYLFHLHHMHISFEQVAGGMPSLGVTNGRNACLAAGCGELSVGDDQQCMMGDGALTTHWRASHAPLEKPARRLRSGHGH